MDHILILLKEKFTLCSDGWEETLKACHWQMVNSICQHGPSFLWLQFLLSSDPYVIWILTVTMSTHITQSWPCAARACSLFLHWNWKIYLIYTLIFLSCNIWPIYVGLLYCVFNLNRQKDMMVPCAVSCATPLILLLCLLWRFLHRGYHRLCYDLFPSNIL